MMKTDSEPSQEKLIFEALTAAPGVPIPMPVLAAAAGCLNVHTRCHALNQAHGKIIWNLMVRHGRRWHSCYYYRPLADANKEPEFTPV